MGMSRSVADMPVAQTARAPRRHAWLQMLRPPNLFTVPGDPLAGWLLASLASGGALEIEPWQVVLAAMASLLLYAGGLLQNDCFDLAEDRLQRPDRPLPAGRASPGAVLVAAFALALCGLTAAEMASPASGLAAAILAVTMTAYNFGAKRVRLLGPMLMGTCRGLSLLVGAGLAGPAGLRLPGVWLSAAGLTAFIAAVTLIASRETEAIRVGPRRWAPAAIVAGWLGILPAVLPPGGVTTWVALVPAGWAVFWMVRCAGRLKGQPAPRAVQQTIGQFIGGLLFIQAALASHGHAPGLWIAAGLLGTWPLSRRLARWFYAS